MREILFRGKRKDNGRWIFGDLIHRRVWMSEIMIIRTGDNGFDVYTEYEVIPQTVGQYTGLTDKNGVKIFEGDIIRMDYCKTISVNYDPYTLAIDSESVEGYFIGVATLTSSYGACLRKPINHINEAYEEDEKIKCNGYKTIRAYRSMVIGNIHDNPEPIESEVEE